VFGDDGELPCPEVCPENPPETCDPCTIDERYLCDYGGLVDCDDPLYSSPFEKRCRCPESGKEFVCEQKLCPVTCPETKVICVHRFSKSRAIMVRSAVLEKKLAEIVSQRRLVIVSCCNTGGEHIVHCANADLPFCPELCPEIQPLNYESCGSGGTGDDDRFSCYYNWDQCPGTGRPLVPATTCSCSSGTFWCYEDCSGPPVEAPAIAPTIPPALPDSEVVQLIIENMMMKRERWGMKKPEWKLDDSDFGKRKRRLRGE
jgi:hypothetical protein